MTGPGTPGAVDPRLLAGLTPRPTPPGTGPTPPAAPSVTGPTPPAAPSGTGPTPPAASAAAAGPGPVEGVPGSHLPAGDGSQAGSTGQQGVDAVLAELGRAEQLPPDQQIAAYESVHRTLQETLRSIEQS